MSGSALSILGQYRQASFRGIPFAVRESGGDPGRKIALHDYPFRDTVWPEDIGRKRRTYRIRGFVTGPLYLTQRDLLVAAAEQNGPGLFVHPTIGIIQASVMRFGWTEPDGTTGVVELEWEFVEFSSLLTTTILIAATAVIEVATVAFGLAASSDYASDTAAPYALGQAVVSAAAATAATWAQQAVAAGQSPLTYGVAVAGLAGNFSRFAAGGAAAAPIGATVQSLLETLTVSQTTIAAAAVAASTPQDASNLAVAILAVPEAVRSAVADPAAQISVLLGMTGYQPLVLASTAPIGSAIGVVQTATAALCRRATLLSIALACSGWQPTSYDDAEALRTLVGPLLDDEALIAADAGDDQTYQALRALRIQVLTDLANRASQLPHLITVQRNLPIPALLLAQQLYTDASRAPDLMQRADAVHPAFMPTTFMALAS